MIRTGHPCVVWAATRRWVIVALRSWSELIAWCTVVVGCVLGAVFAAASGISTWWLIEASALTALAGGAVGIASACRREAALRHARRSLRLAERHASGVLFEASADGVIRRVAGASATILGRAPQELVGMPLGAIARGLVPDEDARPDVTSTWEGHWRLPDGGTRLLAASLDWADSGTPGATRSAVYGFIHPPRASADTERALRESEERFRRVFDAAHNGIILADHSGRILLTNDALRELLAYGDDVPVPPSLAQLVHPSFIDQLMAMMASRAWSDAAPVNHEVQLVTSAGTSVDVEISLAAIHEDDRVTGILIEVRDLTEARRAFEAIRRMSDYDRLTELPNRDLFGRHLERALMDAEAAGRSVGVVLLDLDRFKLINDTLGHASGDRLLRAVAERLAEELPPRHVLARFSGDEYLVLCPDISGIAAAEGTARRILGSFAEPFVIDGHSLRVTATAGVSVFPMHAQDGSTLIRLADAALHAAKADGGNGYRTGSNDTDDPTRRRFQLESDLRLAVQRRELIVYYQPQVDRDGGEIRCFEALLRWPHPEHGMVSPEEFVPLLEETGLIVEVGEQVLRTAVAQARDWRDRGLGDVRVAVNLSPRQFLVADLDRSIGTILAEAGLPPEALEVELTETGGLLDLESVSGTLDRLHEMGVTTAIDDFGIGQSWLGRLQQFNIAVLKVDRTFITHVVNSPNDFAIVQAIVALGHALGMTVVAEGVETREQLNVVHSIGCDLVQGFLYSPPVSAEDAERLLRAGLAAREAA